jgi:serine/threonine protein kinase
LGSAAFSKAVHCVDLNDGSLVCIKIIKNNKDFFDQSLDEIKLLRLLNCYDKDDEKNILQLYGPTPPPRAGAFVLTAVDYFYFKEHLFIVTELLRQNLYDFSKYDREYCDGKYFSFARLQKIARQVLTALAFVHSLGIIHCDLKPENILIRSYSRYHSPPPLT